MPSSFNTELETSTIAMAFGDVPMYSCQRKFGEVICADNTLEYSVCYGASPRIPRRTTEEAMSIVSTSASDTSDGVGARTMVIFGYKADFSQTSETVTLNGLTSVNLTGTYIAIYRAYVLTAGTSYTNVGDVIITGASGSVHMRIQSLHGQSQWQYYIVPKGKKAQLVCDDLSVEKIGGVDASVTIRFVIWNTTRTVFREYKHYLLDQAVDDHHHLYAPFSTVLTAGEMVECLAKSTVNNTPVRAVCWYIERDI